MKSLETLYGTKVDKDDGLLRELFENSPVPTVVTDERSLIVMANRAFLRLTMYDAEEVVGVKMSLFKSGRHDGAFYKNFWEKLTGEGVYEGEIWSRCKDATQKLLFEKIRRIEHQAGRYYLGMLEDVTESKKVVDRYRYLATHDALTGLANRTLAKERFGHALSNTLRMGEQLGVLICDLNEFKQVNDLYGHPVGDKLLKEVALRLSKLVRAGDTVSRFGGDEFLIIAERLKKKEQLGGLVKKIEAAMQADIEIEGLKIRTNMSVGYASFPQDALTYEGLLQIADMTMYDYKNRYYGYA